MRPSTRALIWLGAMVAATALPSASLAQGAGAAEQLLAGGDALLARDLAQEEIASGERNAAELLPWLRVFAHASAVLEAEEAALSAFIELLALDPDYKLEADAAELARSRYLEARGYWSSHTTRLSARLERASAGHGLTVSVIDPAQLAARVRVRARKAGSASYLESVRDAGSSAPWFSEFGEHDTVEYSLSLLDEHGNRVWQLGSDERPERLVTNAAPEPLAAPLPAAVPQLDATPPDHARRRRFLALGASAIVLGAGAVTGGALANIERERLARDWNAGECAGTSGTTRGELCSSEHERLQDMQRLSLVLYPLGAGALVTGLVLLIVAPPRPRALPADTTAALRCHHGPGELGFGCSLTY